MIPAACAAWTLRQRAIGYFGEQSRGAVPDASAHTTTTPHTTAAATATTTPNLPIPSILRAPPQPLRLPRPTSRYVPLTLLLTLLHRQQTPYTTTLAPAIRSPVSLVPWVAMAASLDHAMEETATTNLLCSVLLTVTRSIGAGRDVFPGLRMRCSRCSACRCDPCDPCWMCQLRTFLQ